MTQKKFKLIEKRIHMGLFDFSINFIIGSYQEAMKYANWKLEDEETNLEEFDKGYEPLGKCFFRAGFCPIVWIPREPKTPREYATLCHEMFHATNHLMDWANVPLTNTSEEVYCHSLAHLVNEALDKKKKKV